MIDLLRTYLRPQAPRVLFLAALLTASLALQLINPQILRRFIDSAAAGGALPAVALTFVGLALVQQALAAAARYVAENVGWTATNRLRRDLLARTLRLDLGFHKAHTPGELIERIDGDVSLLATFFSTMLVDLLTNGVLLAGILVLLYREDWRAGLTMTLFAAAAMGVLAAIRGIAVPHYRSLRELAAEFFGFLGEVLGAREDLRAAGAETYVMNRFAVYQRRWLPLRQRAAMRGISIWATGLTLIAIGAALALGVGAYLHGRGLITIGTVYLIFHYTELLAQPISQIRQQIQELQSATAGITRVTELLEQKPRVLDGEGTPLPTGALEVALDKVSFGYDDGDHVLKEISFRLAPGKVLGLLGRTGSGKSSLARLLLRLYDPDQGAVRLGGVDARRPALRQLRSRAVLVTQEVQLFSATVRENLTFFDPSIADSRLTAVLAELGLTPWLASLPLGLDTVIEATGLSAGEAQLLAFARAFLQDPGLVILDEASSRLDPATEALIERAVDRLLAGRTGIIIAHRLATVERADEILILDDGRIAEHGDRRRLAAEPSSRFAGLCRAGLEEVLA
ncbi:MAG TPA: ABC transporter ATP-binding protein [Symbiobacteriaceae bacterium]|nr:ABC transporter ATP-binding protein [Symbiobacteriaceae bacterium]